MKRSLKVVSVLLAMVMGFSGMTIGVSSAYADYSSPAGYDSLDHPYISIAQCGSMLLDYLDQVLGETDLIGVIDAKLWSPVHYNFTSVDNALNSVIGIMNSGLVKDAKNILNLGDLEKIKITAINNSPRRGTPGRTDLEIVYALTQFLADNKNIIGRIVDSCWDNGGIVKNWIDINEIVGDVHGLISDALYNAFVKPLGYSPGQITDADKMLDYFVANMLFGEDGLLPNLPEALADIGYNFTYSYGSTSGGQYTFTTTFSLKNLNVYQLFRGCLNSALLDFAKPALTGVIDKLDDQVKTMVYSLLEIELDLSTEEVVDGLIDFEHGYLTKYIVLDATGFYLTNDFYTLLTNLLQVARGLISNLSLFPNVEQKTESEIAAITNESELVAYLIRTVLVGIIDFVDIPANVTTIREVATYLLINYITDKLPEIDYDARIASGEIKPKLDGALVVLSDVAYYYLNAKTTMDIPQGLTFEQTITWVFNWAISQWGGLLKTDNLTGTVWEKIDRLLWHNVLDVTILPNKYSALSVGNITRTLLFDDLIYAILDWNLESVVAIFRSNTSSASALNQNVNKFLITTIKRILNGMFQGNPANDSTLVMNSTITCLNDIIVDKSNTSDSNKTNLRVMAEKLIERLTVYDSNILTSALPLFVRSLAKVDDSAYEVYAPDGTYFSDIDLENMLANHMPGNEQVVNYNSPGYVFIESEDFRPMYKYYNYKDVRDDAIKMLKKYREGSVSNPVTDDDITNITYRLDYYYNRLSLRDANASQLQKERVKAAAAYGYGEYGEAEGSKGNSSQFSRVSWRYYMEAYSFAQSVYEEYLSNYDGTLRQAKITYARKLLVSAQKMLKLFSGVATSYIALDQQINIAEAALVVHNTYPYYQDTIDNLLIYLNIAREIDRDYDSSYDDIIMGAADDLRDAIDELVTIPHLERVYSTQVVFDKSNNRLWGFKENISALYSFVTAVGAGSMDITKSPTNGNGTGAIVRLVGGESEILEQYSVIVFGDLDGNSKADGTDANLVYAFNADLIEETYFSVEQLLAADANNDGRIDVEDYNLLVQAGLLKVKIDQRGIA
ncbi:MAG: hypothetical protein GX107_03195 [Clostridiales bacterium]|jgi:hypothetical protein|nr:hypothetical protein [Clostridiales bacterium]